VFKVEFEVIQKAIIKVLGVYKDEVQLETNFSTDLCADSLDLYQVLMLVEEELQIEIDAEQLKNIHTVSDAVDYVKENRKE